jgi:hypothetical protein
MAVILGISGCNHSPDLSAGDDPEQGYMNRLTADQIFTWVETDGKSGAEIRKFRSAEALKNYLEGTGTRAAAGFSLLTLNRIDGKPVVRIAANAFTPATKGGADDITTVVSRVTLPESIEGLGANLFAGTAQPVTVTIPPAVAERLPPAELKAAAGTTVTIQKTDPAQPGKAPEVIVQGPSGGSSSGGGGGGGGGGSGSGGAAPVQHYPPKLAGDPVVAWSTAGVPSITFTFDMNIPAPDLPGWTVTANGPAITAIPDSPTSGDPVSLGFTVANPQDPDKTTDIEEITLMPVSGPFSGLSSGSEYTVVYADEYGAAGLHNGVETFWQYVEDPLWAALFAAIYIPNAPDSTDAAIWPKAAWPYDEEISRAARNLFRITGNGTNPADCAVEIKGMALPAATGMGPNHIIVVDIGLPGTDNSGIPVFTIPAGGLGTAGQQYGYLRFRVNRGAQLVVRADNSGYIAAGEGHPCPPGNAAGAAVEVMDYGKLRLGAYEGYPLGEGARIIVRLHAALAFGPESSFGPSTPGYVEERDQWYSGWLIGPAALDPGIAWGTGDQNGDYVEIYGERLAFSANLTVQKTLKLRYSLWFVNGPTLTINAVNDSRTIDGSKGLFAGAAGYKFYGTSSTSGGINIGTPAARILLRPGSVLSRSFLTTTDQGSDLISPGTYETPIVNQGSSGALEAAPYDPASGYESYLNWNIPN